MKNTLFSTLVFFILYRYRPAFLRSVTKFSCSILSSLPIFLQFIILTPAHSLFKFYIEAVVMLSAMPIAWRVKSKKKKNMLDFDFHAIKSKSLTIHESSVDKSDRRSDATLVRCTCVEAPVDTHCHESDKPL